jgi:hypothetical protein
MPLKSLKTLLYVFSRDKEYPDMPIELVTYTHKLHKQGRNIHGMKLVIEYPQISPYTIWICAMKDGKIAIIYNCMVRQRIERYWI